MNRNRYFQRCFPFRGWIPLLALCSALAAEAAEYHVAKTGADTNTGLKGSPFLTIRKAAEVAQSGDVITVHDGIYREEVNPPRGGLSDQQRITYQAAEGETVSIRGSEIVTGWIKEGEVWKTEIPNSLFGNFNPFADVISGDWFKDKGRDHHTSCVYLDHDGSPIRIANDYFGQPRDPQNPTPGPFETPPAGRVKLQVW